MIELDRSIFLFLNSLHTPFMDEVMWIVSMKVVWIPLYLAIIWMIFRQYGKRVWIPLALVPVLVLIDDQGSTLIKNLTARPRPCREPALAGMVHTVNGYCAGMYGFVSGHASNSFGIAMFSSLLLGKRWIAWFLFVWAFLVSYSRIYLGVHYPGDVIGGALLGLIAGSGLAWIAVKIDKSVRK
jgi:undecaprenyl-diphosphatase